MLLSPSIKFVEIGKTLNKCFHEIDYPHPYFLEKAKYKAKTCEVLFTEDQTLVKDPEQILNMQHKFYEQLYSHDKSVKFNVPNQTNVSISDEEKRSTEEDISFDEFALALKQMKNGKCPGLDGIPCDFWKVFFGRIGKLMHKVITYALDNEALWDSAMRGVINLIPKAK